MTTPEGASPRPRLSGFTIVAISVGIVLFLLFVVSCTVNSSSSDDAEVAEVSKYTQTWTTAYSETTCNDWLSRMTPAQQFAASADILTAARNKIDGGSGLPADSLIEEFSDGINNVCVIPDMTLTDATYGLYTTEPRFQP